MARATKESIKVQRVDWIKQKLKSNGATISDLIKSS